MNRTFQIRFMTEYPVVSIPSNPDFMHLSDDSFQKMVEEYYAYEYSSDELLDKYDVSVAQPHKLQYYFPPFQHYECICPDCEVVSWIRIGSEFDSQQPYCPVCRKFLRSDINSDEKLFYLSTKDMDEHFKNMYNLTDEELTSEDQDISIIDQDKLLTEESDKESFNILSNCTEKESILSYELPKNYRIDRFVFQSYADEILKLKSLFDQGVITENEFKELKGRLIKG